MADVVETTKVEEETPIKEVTKAVPAGDAVVTPDEKAEVPAADEKVKEGENGSAEEEVNGGTNGNAKNGNGVAAAETTEETEGVNLVEESLKRKSEGVEVADATDGVSAEKKAKLEEKSEAVAEDGIEAPKNGAQEETA